MTASDQGFGALGSKLTTANAPYNRFAAKKPTGNFDDTAHYMLSPGTDFLRPWLAIRGGPAFQWPLGLEGFQLIVDPTLGIHKFIGDNAVTVDVIHAGEEHFTLNGTFPGFSAPDLVSALRDIVYQGSPEEGKILWLPEKVVNFAQRVQVVHFEAARSEQDRGYDMTYSIEFVRMGILKEIESGVAPGGAKPQPKPGSNTAFSTHVDAKHNTLRKIAKWKLHSTTKWRHLYDVNSYWFIKHSIPLAKAPDHRLPPGLLIRY